MIEEMQTCLRVNLPKSYTSLRRFGMTTGIQEKVRKAWLGCLVLVLVTGVIASSNPPDAFGAGFIDKDTFYYLNISYFRGGFLSDSRLIVTINKRKVDFFGEEYSKIMQYGGTDSSIVNNLLVKGKNTISVEIERVKGAGAADKEPCTFHLVLERKKKGEIVDTGKSVSPIFEVNKELTEGDVKKPLIAQGEFVLQ
jgi:hypothetical protein